MERERAPAPTPALEGRLVRLRARERADLARLNEMFNDPEVLAGLLIPFPQSMGGIREWEERTRTADDQVVFVIEALAGREAVGVCSLEGIEARARRAEFGIWVGKPYWGRGYGTDATRIICRFGFRQMNLHRIGLHVFATNPRAEHVYANVGFRREGVLRESHFLGGECVNVVLMGLLVDELVE